MKEILDKLISIEKEASKKRGDFYLFALFLRENSPDKWDILVSAPWIGDDFSEPLRYLSEMVQNLFTGEEILKISRIVIIDNDNPELPDLQKSISNGTDIVELKDEDIFGLHIRRAFLLPTKMKTAA